MSTALVTGATAGIGRQFAEQLAAKGVDLVLVARDEARLAAVAGELSGRHGVAVEVLPADLSDRAQLERVAERLRDAARPVDLLVNNAGYSLNSRFVDSAVEAEEQLLDVLVRAVLVLTHAAAGPMRERGHGAVLNVASVAAFITSGTYSAAKSWVTVFSESLDGQLAGTGVQVMALLPGYVRTEFHERAAMSMDGLPRITWLKAPYVVEQALRDAAKGSVLSIPSVKYRTAGEMSRIAPRPLVRAMTSPNWYRRLQARSVERSRRRASRRNLRAPWQREDDAL